MSNRRSREKSRDNEEEDNDDLPDNIIFLIFILIFRVVTLIPQIIWEIFKYESNLLWEFVSEVWKKQMKRDNRIPVRKEGTYKKTLYVKLFAEKRLSGARSSIRESSDIDVNIQIDRKNGDIWGPYERIRASNGVKYIPVHLKGGHEAMEMAVKLIQDRVGKDNVVDTIILPSEDNIGKNKNTSDWPWYSDSVQVEEIKKQEEIMRKIKTGNRKRSQQSRENNEANNNITVDTPKTINSNKQTLDKDDNDTMELILLVCLALGYGIFSCGGCMHFHLEHPYCSDFFSDMWYYLLVGYFIAAFATIIFLWKQRNWLLLCPALVFYTPLCMPYGCMYFQLDYCPDKLQIGEWIEFWWKPLYSFSLMSRDCIISRKELAVILGSVLIFAYRYIIGTIRILLKLYRAKRIAQIRLYQTKRIEKTIYVKPPQSNILTGKQGRRKRKGIINKSDVEDIRINKHSDSDDYLSVHVVGSRQAVQKAIVLIQEAVSSENAEEEYVSTDQHLISPPTQTTTSSPAVAADISTDSEPQPNQDDVSEDGGSAQPSVDNVSSDTPEAQEQTKPDSASNIDTDNQEQQSTTIQDHIVTEDDVAAPLTTEPVDDEDLPSTLEQPQLIKDGKYQLPIQQECTVPSEIGINSAQGITTREAITESSVSSVNDGSKASKALSTFDMNENEPLLIFLRSQHACIRGSVDDFYTWLVKSEYIDSMTALKEAVSDDDYYYDTMKVGSGSSGIKVFKRKVFKRALSEYEGNGNKEPATDLNEPPEELVCPISLVLMTNDPVVAADGVTYERSSIEDWFKKSKAKGGGICSPVHGTELKSLILTPNISVRNMARAFKDEK